MSDDLEKFGAGIMRGNRRGVAEHLLISKLMSANTENALRRVLFLSHASRQALGMDPKLKNKLVKIDDKTGEHLIDVLSTCAEALSSIQTRTILTNPDRSLQRAMGFYDK